MKALLAVAAIALTIPSVSMAWDQPAPPPPPKHHHHHHGGKPPVVTPPVVTPVQENRQAFCVTSVEGLTYLDLTVGGMNPGTAWRAFYDAGATVVVGGRSIKLVNTGQAGIHLATSTC